MEELMRFAQSVILLLLVALTPLGADTGPNEDSSARTQISRRLTETSASDGPQAMALIFLPQQQEIQLALSAGPEHLRLEATVYVFGKRGYEKIRSGKNGFTCLVNPKTMAISKTLFPPHYMIYAPDITNADIGINMDAY